MRNFFALLLIQYYLKRKEKFNANNKFILGKQRSAEKNAGKNRISKKERLISCILNDLLFDVPLILLSLIGDVERDVPCF